MARHSIFFRWAFVLLLFGLGLPAVAQLSLNDNALDLLPGEAVQSDIRLLQQMGLVDRLFVTLSAGDSFADDSVAATTALRAATEQLGRQLRESGKFSFVLSRLPEGYERSLFESLQPSLPHLFAGADLRILEERISPDGILERLRGVFALVNSPAGIALKKQVQRDPLGITSIVLQKLGYLKSEFSMHIEDGFFVSGDGRNYLVLAESQMPLTDSDGAHAIDSLLDDFNRTSGVEGIELHTIGSLPHTLANSRMIQRDLRMLLPLASVLLVLLLALSLRDIRAAVVFGVPFLAAPPAIGMTLMFHGKLSGLALGFGIVLFGIAVDFSVHLYLALSREPGGRSDVIKRIARPIFFALLTTSAVFLVLLFSQVPSHRQMATLALLGILLAVLFAWLVIPTIIPEREGGRKTKTEEPLRLPSLSLQSGKLIIVAWLLLIACGFAAWPQLRYNGDLRVLDVPDPGVKADEAHFSAVWGDKGEQAFVIVRGRSLGEVLDSNSKVFTYLTDNGIEHFQSFAPILPGPTAQAENLAAWRQFWDQKQPQFAGDFAVAAASLGFREDGFLPFFEWLASGAQPLAVEPLMQGALQPLLLSLLKRTSSSDGTDEFLAMTTVTFDDTTQPLLMDIDLHIPGAEVLANITWRTKVEHQLRQDIIFLSLGAGIAIVILVTLQFRAWVQVIAVLAPVIAALSAMTLFCYVTGNHLNMMHLIMGIMVIGLSVDYGIFIVCARTEQTSGTSLLAVSICAASSLVGFGVLAFASHPALHALGITVLIGIGVAWPTAVFVSPALLHVLGRR